MKTKVLLLLCLSSLLAQAHVRLPRLFSDGMVLQQNTNVNIWGWADPGEEVLLIASWNPNDTLKVKGNRYAKWKLELPTPKAGGPYEITFLGYNSIHLTDVLIGEVWLASGQSNMEWSASAGIKNQEEAIQNSTYKNIRFFDVPKTSAPFPQQNLEGKWVESEPETMKYFSAIGYFFAQKLHTKLDVPIGIIGSNWGGTAAEVWMPESIFKKDSLLQNAASKLTVEQWGPNEPGAIYNAMINPIIPYNLAGVIWYQGESNTGSANQYEYVFKQLIENWRASWQQEIPFYFAQIAPYNYGDNDNGVSVRDAQRRTLSLPHTGMVFTGDVGNFENIHPRDKEAVGLRFANVALKETYKNYEAEVYGPLVKKAYNIGKHIIVEFSNAENLHFKENKSLQFEVAAADMVFKPVKAKLKNGKVILKNHKVTSPKYVRYAWKNAIVPNLRNEANLPASSFMIEIE
ncbi:sialate O-acetylesterase [Mesonia aestuariivivens]|uniref:Sialate O-acetylesterase n=1 Tax=Mesonia aestuariivivens TaxID=2796128 RepID=A0ABS6W4J0_9FLAO|nr:sialate O-acetylesterase [Mesonia aestuariivivens]MBW2962739.1 sialate O-acetylesterase [Mesonia aestuariivivens]